MPTKRKREEKNDDDINQFDVIKNDIELPIELVNFFAYNSKKPSFVGERIFPFSGTSHGDLPNLYRNVFNQTNHSEEDFRNNRHAKLQKESFDFIQKIFFNSDLKKLLLSCRDCDNNEFDEDEIEEMIVDLREHGKTINQPFCFAPGAVAIKQQLVKMFSCHDVEVGIYVSKNRKKDEDEDDVINDFAEWHWDENLNFTLQLSGMKQWKIAPGHKNPLSSGMNNTQARNAYEVMRNQTRRKSLGRKPGDDDLAPADEKCDNIIMLPGDLLRVRAGEWHHVESCERATDEITISINVRIAHITPARLAMEQIFATMTRDRIYGDVQMSESHVQYSHSNFRFDGGDDAMDWIKDHKNLQRSKNWCPLIRILPFDASLSNGLVLGTTVSKLLALDAKKMNISSRFTKLIEKTGYAHIRPNLLLAMSIIDSDVKFEGKFVPTLKIQSTSSLTNFDYMSTIILHFDGKYGELLFNGYKRKSDELNIWEILALGEDFEDIFDDDDKKKIINGSIVIKKEFFTKDGAFEALSYLLDILIDFGVLVVDE